MDQQHYGAEIFAPRALILNLYNKNLISIK